MKNISVEVLSKKYKVSKSTIIRCLKINNIDVKKKLLLSTEEITNLCKLYLNNYSVKELSKKYKISKATVLTYLKTNNSYPRNFISSHTQYPILLKEFHSILNGNLKLTDFTYGSNKKVWWKCEVSDDHIWQSTINNRFRSRGCPCCSGKKTVLSNCLATTNPEISNEWHPTKNLPLTPFEVVNGSKKRVWWKCDEANDHEWEAAICDRFIGNGCPCCRGFKVVLSNCLATTHPNISKQWHPTKNINLTPYDVTFGSNKKVWWKCDISDDHEWKSYVASKTNSLTSNGCPCCSGLKTVLSNCLATTNPEMAKQWHPTKNALTPFDVTSGSGKKVWWKCKNNHDWIAKINYVANCINLGGTGCSLCYDSNGEKAIKSILNKINIHYEISKTFDDCRHEKKLRFDFYLTKHNILIEYDGIQHFKEIDFFGGVNGLLGNKKRDKIKNEYASKNNIPLLRIPYTKFNSIESEIKDFLNKNNIKINE